MANLHDITETEHLLHGEERFISADSGYRGAQKREELKDSKADCLIAEMPSKVHLLKKRPRVDKQSLRTEYVKASIQAKVEHPFQIIKLAMLYALANVFRIDQMIRAARD